MQITSAVSKENHFEKGPIVSTLLSFTAPILLSQLLQQLYNITDCMIVGHFCGAYGLASTGLCGLILSVLINFLSASPPVWASLSLSNSVPITIRP